ncbi:MAG: SUMF1/EgtB/PvdO family nonheme iron enzyme [Planctomycetota bacterium]
MRRNSCSGFSAVEVLAVLAFLGLLITLACPLILGLRESARNRACAGNLKQLGVALHAYHDTFKRLPPAAVWGTDELKSLALHKSQRVDLFTRSNWALLLLPFTSESARAESWNRNLPIADDQNSRVRETSLPLMTCASDNFSQSSNPHVFEPVAGVSIAFARGNYAINGGSHSMRMEPGSTSSPTGDGAHLRLDRETREFQYSGNGIAGFNVSFSLDDFENGSSSLVALEEVRAGIHAVDPRGVWAFGQIGSSVTWAHGVNGDDYGPNNPWPRSDDLMGCSRLHDAVGTETLMRENMPCVSYLDTNTNSTARSRHSNGANVLLMDGSTKFIANNIDPACWHVMHSRETPRGTFAKGVDHLLNITNETSEAARPQQISWPSSTSAVFTNSVGMELVLIPAGEFEMGIPDARSASAPADVPPHLVQIQHSFFMGTTEVTQRQFKAVLLKNPSFHTTSNPSNDATADFPVEQVSWNDSQAFCDALSALPAEQKAGRQYRLPTEAEWEYCCRAGSREKRILASSPLEAEKTGEMAGMKPDVAVGSVGRFPVNAFGLYDMRGNVWEWCSDWFDRDYYARSPAVDPQGPGAGFLKVVRGGDWVFVGENCMINYPVIPPWKSSPFIGFRVVCFRTSLQK